MVHLLKKAIAARKRIANEVKVNSFRDGYKITVTIIKLFLLKISNKLNLFYKV